jgi:predicted nucleic-acid-binding protein
MSDHHANITLLDVDEAWIDDWAAAGIAALEQYLARHAAFAEYLRKRDAHLHSDYGDPRADA